VETRYGSDEWQTLDEPMVWKYMTRPDRCQFMRRNKNYQRN